MQHLSKSAVFITLFVLSLSSAFAQLRLPNVFSDHMVLQRETNINLWGSSHPSANIRAVGSWSADTSQTDANANGQWRMQLATPKAGGPYTLTILSNGQKITYTNILIGDVFLCSGQSNMEWGGNQNLKEIMDELPNAKNSNIRLLQIDKYGTYTEQENISTNWQELSAASLKPFSSIGYFIAKKLNRETGIPIGVINASWGGTGAEVWTSKQLVENDTALLNLSKMQTANPYRPHENGVLWNGMIHPIKPYTIAGAFWYQGESNVGSWQGYDKLMRTLVNSWRKEWNTDFPFYFVQIAPYTYNNPIPKAALLREQQNKTALELSKSGMVVITDLVDNIKDIHPVQKREVANRLATLVLADHYKQTLKDYRSPLYKEQKIIKSTIEISFHYLEQGLIVLGGKDVTELFIAGSDKVFHPAKGVMKGNKLIVSAKEVQNPVAVRFGFSETAIPNLFTTTGLPVAPFRTDSWDF